MSDNQNAQANEEKHLPSNPAAFFSENVTPSDYSNDNEKLKLILFNRIHPDVLDRVKDNHFDLLQTFHQAPPLEAFPEILETVNSLEYSQLINPKKKILNDFVTFLRQKIPAKTAYNIVLNWAPIIPKYVDNIDSVLDIIIRLANQAEDGNKVLYWLSNALFPKTWAKKSSLMNSKIGAVCRCILPPNRKAYWAILDTNKNFKLYQLKKNAAVLDFECKVSRTRVHEDGKSVVITDIDGNDVKTFLPVDINQAQMWGAALAKQHSPFPYYFSSYQTPLPPEYYHALYEAFTCTDMIIVRCVTNPTVTPPEDEENRGMKLMDALFDVFAHDAKMQLLLSQMVAIDLYSDVKPRDILRVPSNLGNLVNVFVERFGKEYYSKFGAKLRDYIKSKDCFAAGLDAAASEVEVALNTAFKLIYSSAEFVPDQLKHVAQVLFSYSVIKYNIKQDVYTILANFFFSRLLFPLLKNPEFFGGEEESNKNIDGFIEIAKVISQFGKLEGNLADLNNRFQHNVYPKIEQFLFGIAQITKAPIYQGVSKERFVKIIEYVLYCISHKTPGVTNGDSFIQFVQRFNDAALATFAEPLILPNSLHIAIAQYFQFRIDPDIQELAEKGEDLDANQHYFGNEPQQDNAFPEVPMLGGGDLLPVGVGGDSLPALPGKGSKASGGKGSKAGGKGKSTNLPPKKTAVGAAKKTALPGKKPAPAKKGAAAAKKPPAKPAAAKKAAPAKGGAKAGAKPGAKKPPAKGAPAKKAAPAKKGPAAKKPPAKAAPAKKAPPKKAPAKKAPAKKK